VPYPLQPVPDLQDYILTNMQSAGDVHEMYEMSLSVEPREREDEKIARYVRETIHIPWYFLGILK
jgi:son of sevenless-like protein